MSNKLPLIIAASLSSQGFGQTFINGDFDASSPTYNTNASGTLGPGWTISNASPDIVNLATRVDSYGNHPSGPFAFPGSETVSLQGGSFLYAVSTEAFSQTLSGFNIGTQYSLSWEESNFGANLFSTAISGDGGWSITADGTIIGSSTLDYETAWRTNSTTFTAGEEEITFNFTSVNSGTSSKVGIDNIQLSAVPEPSSAALLGLGGLVLLRRRRK